MNSDSFGNSLLNEKLRILKELLGDLDLHIHPKDKGYLVSLNLDNNLIKVSLDNNMNPIEIFNRND
jgi:hypothetical protein